MEPPEVIEVEDHVVRCDGGTQGHPTVYLNMGESGSVDCPYCGRQFRLKEGAQAGAGH